MNIILSNPRGFCAGVVRAIDIVELTLKKYGSPVYVKHEIVHNQKVVKEVEQKGAITVENVEEIPNNSVVIFSAHGSNPKDFSKAKEKNLLVIDATCPLVTKVHNEAKKYSNDGKKIILVGHRGHQEVKGTMGQTSMTLIDEREKWTLDNIKPDEEVAVLTQTTLSVKDTSKAVNQIKRKFPNALVRNDICYATTNRQDAVKELALKTDLVLVIGSQNSSNCKRLQEVSESLGTPSFLIMNPEEILPEWIEGEKTIGITSGASTPEGMVQKIVQFLNPSNLTSIDGTPENITFKLPKELEKEKKS
ncbi:MAG: 4-hydroxy-3-methylbut-2-enyl diphosphate reductase [Chloroflexi bacterium]|nr:4-hydroxy-3-methylbut-2-enyl diphosphate reductase [Chloroflexota bacterium]|tara:strand:- start:382 stop:1296 length:915 start_codon:yes stop_codon:yes gene_type:complete